MTLLNIVILAIVQGFAELPPVSSSAHVVVAEKLLGLDPSSPQMTLLLVMLHTGTMFAVIVFFWQRWSRAYFQSFIAFKKFAGLIAVATALTVVVGGAIIKLVEKAAALGEIENLFRHLEFIAPALAVAGLLILVAGIYEKRRPTPPSTENKDPDIRQAGAIGAVQGLCLPFRGFSRSGATISTAMLLGVAKARAETFSFALAVVLTPPVVVREILRLMHAERSAGNHDLVTTGFLSLFGAVVAFGAGLLALKWLGQWLERGRWHLFGICCLVASAAVAVLHHAGY